MVDNFSILLTHMLLLLAAWRLLSRDDLDVEPAPLDQPADDARGWNLPDA
ncbi:MAG: hypothetical protein U5J78_00550 [Parasphingorhabdus sp.]|nr:hypothetical protein [Parasphingorhabdus sp.]